MSEGKGVGWGGVGEGSSGRWKEGGGGAGEEAIKRKGWAGCEARPSREPSVDPLFLLLLNAGIPLPYYSLQGARNKAFFF